MVGSQGKKVIHKIMSTTEIDVASSRALPSENNIPQTDSSRVNEHY